MTEMDYVNSYLEEEVTMTGPEVEQTIQKLEKRMKQAAEDLNFEEAIKLRDQIAQLQKQELGLRK